LCYTLVTYEKEFNAKKQKKKKKEARLHGQNEHTWWQGRAEEPQKKAQENPLCMTPAPPAGSLARLAKNYEYQRVYRRGRLARGRAVWVYLLPRDDKKVRLGVSVSRKVAKKATDRNKLKRSFKELMRCRAKSAAFGYDTVVVVKKAAPLTSTGLKAIREELTSLLDRLADKVATQ